MTPLIRPLLKDEALICDIHSADTSRGEWFLWWLGQSGYVVRWSEWSEPFVEPPRLEERHLLIDPYLSDSLTIKYANTAKPHVRMSERVVDPRLLSFVDVVTSSHAHTDHLDAATLQPLRTLNPELELVAPAAILPLAAERFGVPIDASSIDEMVDGAAISTCGPHVTAIPSAHDQLDKDDRGRNLYLGYVFRFADATVYHSGDTVVYDGMVERLLKEGPIDIAILPINGKVGNMGGRDAARLAKAINARLVIPCHYDMFEFNTADPADEFIPECERLGQHYRVLKLGERFSSSELPARE